MRRRGYQRDDVRKRRTRVVSTRVDDETLAKLLMAFDGKQIEVASISELVYLACLSLVGVAGLSDLEIDPVEARMMVSERFNLPVDPPSQNKSAFYKHIHVTEAFKETSDRIREKSLPPLNARRPKDYTGQRLLAGDRRSQTYSDEDLSIEQVKEIEQQVRERLKREQSEKDEMMKLAKQHQEAVAEGANPNSGANSNPTEESNHYGK